MRKRERDAFSAASGWSRAAARQPQRRMRLLQGLWHDVRAASSGTAVISGERALPATCRHCVDHLEPLRLFRSRGRCRSPQLHIRRCTPVPNSRARRRPNRASQCAPRPGPWLNARAAARCHGPGNSLGGLARLPLKTPPAPTSGRVPEKVVLDFHTYQSRACPPAPLARSAS